MDNIIKEVARAIRAKCAEIEHRPEHAPEGHVPDMMWFADEYAKAAVEAMRYPTNEMVGAGDEARDKLDNKPHPMIINNSSYIYEQMMGKALDGL